MRRLSILLLALPVSPVMAQSISCPLPEQKTMLMVKLYFGQSGPDGKPIAEKSWRDFLARIVSPRFSTGFTVYDASGQWKDLRANDVLRENTRVLEILGQDTLAFRRHIAEITRDYRARFRQKLVGIVSAPACGTF